MFGATQLYYYINNVECKLAHLPGLKLSFTFSGGLT